MSDAKGKTKLYTVVEAAGVKIVNKRRHIDRVTRVMLSPP
jgi:hypothetical protein